MLVQLSVTKPKMTEKDKSTTSEVAVRKHASEASVSVVKKLYPKHLLAPIVEVESSARRYIESVTQPWGRGLAMLPIAMFMEPHNFSKRIGVFKMQFDQAVTVFLNNYSNVLTQAAVDQGDMFDVDAYPDLSQLKAEFTFDVSYPSLSQEGGLVLDLEAEVLAELEETIAKQQTARMAAGQRDLYERLGAAVKRIAVQCSNDKGKIYDSLTGNLSDLLQVLPLLNLSGDEAFASLCEEARQLVVAPEAIRTVPQVREDTAKVANDILAKMKAFI
jgi:hypothetical protein